jgi:hypothetical protein
MRVQECQGAINTACKKLGIARFTHHDLRHLFATRCIESGVDIPTVSRWLGHKDGGALAMKTYGHLRDQHSTNMAQKVLFDEAVGPKAIALSTPQTTVQVESALANGEDEKTAIPKAKAKYSYPWWASKNPVELVWGQLNEPVQIVPIGKYLDCAKQAMNREIFPDELADRQSLMDEFAERIPKAALAAIKAKIQSKQPAFVSEADRIER